MAMGRNRFYGWNFISIATLKFSGYKRLHNYIIEAIRDDAVQKRSNGFQFSWR